MTMTFDDMKLGYAHLWDSAQVGSPHTDAPKLARATAEKILGMRAEFLAAQAATGAPWWWIACTLYREANLNLGCYLGNGQSLARRTTVVPIGRGPFPNFVAGCVDALQIDGLYKLPPSRWTLEFALYSWEKFNGFGYMKFGVDSPYVWNWTTRYNGGKYVADHVFSRTEFDVQGGCAAILKELIALDPTIRPAREGAPTPPLKEITDMATPTTPTLPSGSGFPIALGPIVSAANMITAFLPAQIKPIVDIPLDLLKIPNEIQNSPADVTHVAGIIIKHLRAVADDLAAAFPQPPAT